MKIENGVITELFINIVKMSTAHPAGEVISRNLRIDFKDMKLADFLDKVVESALRVAIQNRRIKTEPTVELARTWTNKTITWDKVYGEKSSVKVVQMTDDEIKEKAKSDPEYRAKLLADLMAMDASNT